MQCPRCQAKHGGDARFCEDCGARLEFACPRWADPPARIAYGAVTAAVDADG
jgi:hypothetical protein